jgi:hypothetical protein
VSADASAGMGTDANVELVRAFWAALADRDFDRVGSFMAGDGHYVDVLSRTSNRAPGGRPRPRPGSDWGWARCMPTSSTTARSSPPATTW